MPSLGSWKWVVYGGLIGSVGGAALPTITPAPEVDVDFWVKRQQIDPVSFAQALLTAIPQSLRQIAATNAAAVSSILWDEFLDDNKPQWFLDLPRDLQSYLIRQFGPQTAWSTAPATTSGAATTTRSEWSWPTSTSASQPSRSSLSRSTATSRSATASLKSSTLATSRSMTASTRASASGSTSSPSTAPASSDTSDPTSPTASNSGLTKTQKIGLGVGLPIGILGAAAFLLACCFLLRRRKNKHVNGSEPPSSPGFIPRFAFQDRSRDRFDHHAPLNPPHHRASQDLSGANWEDDGVDPFEHSYNALMTGTAYRGNTIPPLVGAAAPMAMRDSEPIMAPALHHTHSSNRARGKRTSYTSLRSVAEVSEPDETMESPILGRNTTPLQRNRRPSLPMVVEMPPSLAAGQHTVKRKPVPTSPIEINPAAQNASRSLLRPALINADHSGSSSSGLALSTNSSNSNYHNEAASPVSPLSDHPDAPKNPFRNSHPYVEDYGPEYYNGYVDISDGLYGGHRSLNRYPDPSPPPRKNSKSEWPLRNISSHRRNKSPLWDRVYESP